MRHRFPIHVLTIVAGCIGFCLIDAHPAFAQTPSAEPVSERWTADAVRQRASDVESALKAAQQAVTREKADRLGVALEALEARVRQWVELSALYDALLSEQEKRTELDVDGKSLVQDLEAFEQRGLIERPPYALSRYDALIVESETFQRRSETADMALKAAQRNLDDLRIRWRNAQERYQAASRDRTDRKGAGDLWQLEGLQLDVRLADAAQRLHQLRLENLQQRKQLSDRRADLVRRQAHRVRLGLAYDEKDLNEQIAALDHKKKEIQKELTQLRKKKREADRRWLKLNDQSQREVYSKPLAGIEDRLKVFDQWRKTYQEAIDQREEMLRLTDQKQIVWQQRYDLLKQVPERSRLIQLYEQSQEHLDHINRVLPIEQRRLNSLWQQATLLEGAAEGLNATSKKGDAGGVFDALRQMATYRLDYISTLVDSRGLHQRLSEEIEHHLERRPVKYQLERIWAHLRSIWNYQVWVIGDRPLTVRMIFVALVILLAGIMTTKIVIHRVAKRLLNRPQIKPTTAATIEKLLLYFGYLLVMLFALRMVNIPLAAFAFLGGAIAIGIGFGAQNLINNFISGFIIMGEQPINIGDLIEVEGVLGQVEEIGARCTRIRTGENIRILVPNSSFLEKNITNWTLSDRLIRADVTVGVVYGSPVGRVEKLLLQACDEFDTIRKSPEPFVLFTDFGDNALVFKVLFWINVTRVIERRLIESRLRFRIDELFRQADIVIAFPQRDVHLDTAQPVKIQMLDSAHGKQAGRKEQ